MKFPLLAATVLLVILGFTHGAGMGAITTTTIQTLNGQIFKITGAFTVIATNFLVFSSAVPATSSCTWGGGACFMNQLFVGNWTLAFALQVNSGFVPGTYTIQAALNPVSRATITFTIPSTATVSSFNNFYMDLGTATLPSTTASQIIVQ